FPNPGPIFPGRRCGAGTPPPGEPAGRLAVMIELGRDQEIPLVDAAGAPLTRLRMGLGWDHHPTAGAIGTGAPEIDLDASAVQFGGGRAYDFAFYNNLTTRDGSVTHQGDNRSGRGEGDDEAIAVDLSRVHRVIDSIV